MSNWLSYGIGKKLDNIFIIVKGMEYILIWGFKPGKTKAYEKYTNDNSNDQIKLLEDVFIVVQSKICWMCIDRKVQYL